MKAIYCLTALLIGVTPAMAADEKKPPEKKPEAAKKTDRGRKPERGRRPDAIPARTKTDMIDEDVVAILKPYDKNGDFEIDVNEFDAVVADFKRKPSGSLKQFDKGKDGTIDVMIDRAGINVKLGSAAPPKSAASPPPPPPKKPDAPPPPPASDKKPDAPKPPEKPDAKPATAAKPDGPKPPAKPDTKPEAKE